MTMKKYLLILLLFVTDSIFAQSKRLIYNYSIINPAEWIIPKTDTLDYAQAVYEGKPALLLKRKFENYKSASVAYPKGLKFKNGVIELDIASPAGKAGYVGLAFRIRDQHHYETLYFRPGSSGTINAVQYMPEKKFEFNWWDYEAKKYQAKTNLPVDGWFHVKVVVKGSQFTRFINHGSKPVFVYSALDPSPDIGSVGFWLGNCRSGAYRNLKVISQP